MWKEGRCKRDEDGPGAEEEGQEGLEGRKRTRKRQEEEEEELT